MMRNNIFLNRNILFLFTIYLSFGFLEKATAQNLEPGYLSAMPIDGHIAVATTGYSKGNILLDNTLPIENLEAGINNFALGYLHSFKLFNRLTKFSVVVPYAIADFSALVEGEPQSDVRNGLGDPILAFSMMLLGTEALKPQEFFKQEHKKFKLGILFKLKMPLGQYDDDRLINMGTNRWAMKTGLGASYTLKQRIVFEAQLNSWFFSENDDFLVDNTSKQKPLFEGQFHTTYIFKPGIWLAASIGTIQGGATEINGVANEDFNNLRYGLAFSYRFNPKHSLKFAYTNGFISRTGDDFDSFLLAYQFLWFGKK
jgi:hypothetical protein